jgi:hypothetical protein
MNRRSPSWGGSTVYTAGIGVDDGGIFPNSRSIRASDCASSKSPMSIAVALFGW